jgi:hypothetical protein
MELTLGLPDESSTIRINATNPDIIVMVFYAFFEIAPTGLSALELRIQHKAINASIIRSFYIYEDSRVYPLFRKNKFLL